MGKLTTHVLDTANGSPAAGMKVTLLRLYGERTETFVAKQVNDWAPIIKAADIKP